MKRKLTQKLTEWKNRPDHKPLILQGARQVGKTYILEEFGRNHYKNYIKVSLDLVTDVTNFLKDNINPIEIIAYLESLYNQRILPHETLVILDEIQDCKRALLALKYFKEDYPQYDIVAAGSLLGVAVNQGNKPNEDEKTDKKDDDEFSYPVGMVDELNLFPMDFEEFLWATGNDILSQEIRSHYEANEAMPASVHSLALDLYQKYLVIGGMPESVQKWVDTKIRACFNSIPAQLAKENRKFQYKLAMKGGTAKIFGEAIEWLILAGTVHKCKLITHGFIPISAQEDHSDFKIYMSDVGLLNTKTQMPVQMLLSAIETDNTFLGSVAENYVGQALAANGIALRYWKNDNTQEVEFILQDGMNVIPVEVKKGKKVDAISLNNFKKTYNCPFAYRISGKNFGFANGIKAVPLYAVFCIEANGNLESTF